MCAKFLDALNNSTIAALVGSVAAFCLVVANDARRDRKVAKDQLPVLLKQLKLLVGNRLQGVNCAVAAFGAGKRQRNTGLPFPTDRIERLSERAGSWLTDRQSFALGNLTFRMREADRFNANARVLLDAIEQATADAAIGENSSQNNISGLENLAGRRYGEEKYLLEIIQQLIDAYLDNKLNERGGIA